MFQSTPSCFPQYFQLDVKRTLKEKDVLLGLGAWISFGFNAVNSVSNSYLQGQSIPVAINPLYTCLLKKKLSQWNKQPRETLLNRRTFTIDKKQNLFTKVSRRGATLQGLDDRVACNINVWRGRIDNSIGTQKQLQHDFLSETHIITCGNLYNMTCTLLKLTFCFRATAIKMIFLQLHL